MTESEGATAMRRSGWMDVSAVAEHRRDHDCLVWALMYVTVVLIHVFSAPFSEQTA